MTAEDLHLCINLAIMWACGYFVACVVHGCEHHTPQNNPRRKTP